MRKFLILFLAASLNLSAFAVCEQERQEFDYYNDLCTKLGAASGAAALVGAIVIPGIGGLLGLGPGAAAFEACRIKDIKEADLQECQDLLQAKSISLSRYNQKQAILQNHQHNDEINAIYDLRRTRLENKFRAAEKRVLESLVNEGIDIDHPENAEQIEAAMVELKVERDIQIERIEIERKRALKG